MKTKILILGTTLSIVALLAGTIVFAGERVVVRVRAHDLAVVDRAGLLGRADAIAAHLSEVERLATPERDRGHRKDPVARALDRARRDLALLRAELLEAPPAPQVRGVLPMAPGDFQDFLRSVKDAFPAREKVALVRDVAAHARFRSEQVVLVVRAIPFSDEQVDAAAALRGRVVDPENFHLVYAALNFSSAREKLRERLAR